MKPRFSVMSLKCIFKGENVQQLQLFTATKRTDDV